MKTFKFSFKLKHLKNTIRIGFWFSTGAFLSLFFISSFVFLIFQKANGNVAYPGVIVDGKNLGGMTKEKILDFYIKKNQEAGNTNFTFVNDNKNIATVSAKEIDFGYDEDLIASQAFSIGRSGNTLTNLYLMLKAYTTGVYLPASFRYSENKLNGFLADYYNSTNQKPVDALFKFENGRVITFRASMDGQEVDQDKLNQDILSSGKKIMYLHPKNVTIDILIKTLNPAITTESVNNFGIKELIGEGHSTFYHSIQSRIYNINLAASRINGALVAPGDTFSFDKTLGDVSSFTGYQQAYVIQNGRTILGDGGGVCQVSTTFFRAVLNAGLPIVERHAHSYRVGYYEQDSPPGLDATVYVPSVDLKFKNDTGHYILVQSFVDLNNLSLAFYLYGTKDQREVTIGQSVITNQTPPPPPLYQDDPTLPKGQVKQVDFEAWGADVYFTREVKKDGKIIISDKFVSNYQPWQAVYLRGTQ